MAYQDHRDLIRDQANELRDILKASASFDPTSRAYTLVNCLESAALSYHTALLGVEAGITVVDHDDFVAAQSDPKIHRLWDEARAYGDKLKREGRDHSV